MNLNTKRTLKFILLFVLLSCFVSAHSAPSLETYGRLEQVTDVSISPNGELIAFRRTESDDKDFLVVYSIKKKQSVAAVNLNKTDINGHYFANNDFLILISSNHLKLRQYRDSFDATTAVSFNIKTKKTEPLMKLGQRINGEKTVTLGQTGLGRVVGRSADSKTLYMPAFVTESRYDKQPRYSLLAGTIDGKGKLKIIDKGTRHTQDYFLDDQGNVLARENLNNDTNEHSIDVFENNKWRTIYSYTSAIVTHQFVGLNSNFNALVFSSEDSAGYFELSLKSGDVKSAANLEIIKDTNGIITDKYGVVLGFRYGGLTPDYLLANSNLQNKIQDIVKEHKGHSVHLVDWTPDWKHIVVRIEGTQSAGDYFLYSNNSPLAYLVSSRFDVEASDVNPLATTRYKARDGLMIPTILTLPKTKMGNLKQLPTVIMPHGGPAAQDQIGFDYMAQALASRGYLVIQPQFRGSTGFGAEHLEAGWGEWGKAMQDDLSDAVQAFVGKSYVDPERVCIVGASYGGYASLAGAAFTPEQFKCAVSIAGVSHLPRMLSADKKRYGRSSSVLDYWNRSILAGEYDKQAMQDISPYFSADKIQIPVLLLHGQNDTIVEYEQSKMMSKAIKKAKGDVRLVKLKNDDHYLRNGETRTQAVVETVNFVEKHIGQ